MVRSRIGLVFKMNSVVGLFLTLTLILFTVQDTYAAAIRFETSLIPVLNQTNDPNRTGGGLDTPPAVATASTLGIDTRTNLGLVLWEALFVGANFNFRTDSTKQDAVGTTYQSRDDSYSAWDLGPALGYVSGNFRLSVSALFVGRRVTRSKGAFADGTSPIDIRRSDKFGLGFQIMVGYSFPLWGSLRVGPTLVYRKANYTKTTITDANSPANNATDLAYYTRPSEGGLQPMVTLSMDF